MQPLDQFSPKITLHLNIRDAICLLRIMSGGISPVHTFLVVSSGAMFPAAVMLIMSHCVCFKLLFFFINAIFFNNIQVFNHWSLTCFLSPSLESKSVKLFQFIYLFFYILVPSCRNISPFFFSYLFEFYDPFNI